MNDVSARGSNAIKDQFRPLRFGQQVVRETADVQVVDFHADESADASCNSSTAARGLHITTPSDDEVRSTPPPKNSNIILLTRYTCVPLVVLMHFDARSHRENK